MTTQRTTSAHQLSSRIDWGLAQDVPVLYGRADELATLTRWVLKEQCRVVTLVGLGGIGKTSLALTFARQAATNFAAVVFCSLGEAPPFPELLDHLLHRVALIHRLAAQQSVAPTPVVDKLALLIGLLRQERCLLILDNLETLFAVGTTDAHYQAGYEAYETFFKTLSETPHQSCLLLTSRERLPELAAIEGPRMPVRSLQLPGLAEEACRALLTDQDLAGTPDDAAVLARQYAGNPLALKLVADPIRALFSGDIGAFLREGNLFFNGVGQLLAQQISRASFLEQTLLTWLAIGREPIALDQIMQDLAGGTATGPSRTLVLAALHALWRRNLIERGQGHLVFSLQRVVLEYLTERLVDRAADELQRGHFDDLRHHALIQATAKEYVRHSQERLIATPLLARLSVSNASAEMVEQQLLARLAAQRNQPLEEQGYGPGNLINLLRLLRTHLRGLDLAQLAIRQAYLQGVAMQDASLANAFVHNTVFTDIFDALTAVTISSTGEDWAAVSRRGEVLVWAAGGQTLQRTWRAHTALVWTLAFSPDGNTLASGSWDGTVKLWDVATGALRWTGKHASQVNRVAFAPDGQWLASCGSDATVQLWEVQGGALRQTLPHPAPVAVVAWCPLHPIASATSVHLLASGDLAGAIRLWSGQQDSTAQAALVCVQTLLEHTTWVDGLAFAPDGRTLASASYDNTIKLWTIEEPGAPNAERAHLRATLTTHMKWVHRVVWRPDGRVLASCSFDRTVWLWDIEQHNFRAPLQGHNAVVYDLAFTPDNHSLLSASEDGTLRLWDVDNSQCTRMMAGYTGALYDVDWSPDGTQLVSVGTDTLLTLYTITANTGTEDAQVPTQILQGHTNSVFGVSWQPSGHWLASSELDNTIRLWDTRTGAVFQVIHHPEDAANLFYGLAWSPDGQQLASGTAKRGVLVWPIQTNQPRWISQEFPTKIRHVAWHPDGTLVAGGGDDGAVYVWQASDGVLLQRMAGHPSMITSLVWSPTGAYLAASGSGREDGELAIWDVARGERVGALTGHPGLAYALAWGPENNLGELVLISGGADGVLRWWHVQSGACIHARPAHHGAVQGLRRNPAGTLLASCGDDGAIMLCALQTGEQHRTLRRERPYERMKVTGLRGLTEAQRAALLALGAVGD